MEKVLQKLARQLNAYDEASLMSMWDKYAELVSKFEPTKRWEENALIFGFIQALRFKNQLFNYHWAEGTKTALHAAPSPGAMGEEEFSRIGEDASKKEEAAKAKAKVLRFAPRGADQQSEE